MHMLFSLCPRWVASVDVDLFDLGSRLRLISWSISAADLAVHAGVSLESGDGRCPDEQPDDGADDDQSGVDAADDAG